LPRSRRTSNGTKNTRSLRGVFIWKQNGDRCLHYPCNCSPSPCYLLRHRKHHYPPEYRGYFQFKLSDWDQVAWIELWPIEGGFIYQQQFMFESHPSLRNCSRLLSIHYK
jgi:hypothetical protein